MAAICQRGWSIFRDERERYLLLSRRDSGVGPRETCSHCHNGQKGCRSSRGKGFWGNDDIVSRVTWRVIPKGCLALLFIHMSLCPHCGEWTFILRSLLPNSQYLVGSWLRSPSVNGGRKEDLRAGVEVGVRERKTLKQAVVIAIPTSKSQPRQMDGRTSKRRTGRGYCPPSFPLCVSAFARFAV